MMKRCKSNAHCLKETQALQVSCKICVTKAATEASGSGVKDWSGTLKLQD